jgi:hypothetical protein
VALARETTAMELARKRTTVRSAYAHSTIIVRSASNTMDRIQLAITRSRLGAGDSPRFVRCPAGRTAAPLGCGKATGTAYIAQLNQCRCDSTPRSVEQHSSARTCAQIAEKPPS